MYPGHLEVPPRGPVVPVPRQVRRGRGRDVRGQPADERITETMECHVLESRLASIPDEQI